MGYAVDHRIIAGTEYGALTTRKRAVIVAATEMIVWPDMETNTRTMREVLLPADSPGMSMVPHFGPVQELAVFALGKAVSQGEWICVPSNSHQRRQQYRRLANGTSQAKVMLPWLGTFAPVERDGSAGSPLVK